MCSSVRKVADKTKVSRHEITKFFVCLERIQLIIDTGNKASYFENLIALKTSLEPRGLEFSLLPTK